MPRKKRPLMIQICITDVPVDTERRPKGASESWEPPDADGDGYAATNVEACAVNSAGLDSSYDYDRAIQVSFRGGSDPSMIAHRLRRMADAIDRLNLTRLPMGYEGSILPDGSLAKSILSLDEAYDFDGNLSIPDMELPDDPDPA